MGDIHKLLTDFDCAALTVHEQLKNCSLSFWLSSVVSNDGHRDTSIHFTLLAAVTNMAKQSA